jgi:hypothetical protein
MGGRRSDPVASSVIDDVAEVIMIMIILSLPAVLRYPLSRVIVSQASVATG